jgi:hypothetical protein
MRKIAYCKSNYEYPEDVERLVQAVLDNGYEIAMWEAESVWQDYSDDVDASWMILPDTSEEIWEILKPWIVKVIIHEMRKDG